jgi:hypothetical protein
MAIRLQICASTSIKRVNGCAFLRTNPDSTAKPYEKLTHPSFGSIALQLFVKLSLIDGVGRHFISGVGWVSMVSAVLAEVSAPEIRIAQYPIDIDEVLSALRIRFGSEFNRGLLSGALEGIRERRKFGCSLRPFNRPEHARPSKPGEPLRKMAGRRHHL